MKMPSMRRGWARLRRGLRTNFRMSIGYKSPKLRQEARAVRQVRRRAQYAISDLARRNHNLKLAVLASLGVGALAYGSRRRKRHGA